MRKNKEFVRMPLKEAREVGQECWQSTEESRAPAVDIERIVRANSALWLQARALLIEADSLLGKNAAGKREWVAPSHLANLMDASDLKELKTVVKVATTYAEACDLMLYLGDPLPHAESWDLLGLSCGVMFKQEEFLLSLLKAPQKERMEKRIKLI